MNWSHMVSKFSFLELIGAVFSREWLAFLAPAVHLRAKPSRLQ